MTTNDDYRPIDCGTHSELEVLVMRAFRGWVRWREHGNTVEGEARLCDLRTRAGAEYLVIETAGSERALRLDQVQQIVDPSGRIVWRQKIDD